MGTPWPENQCAHRKRKIWTLIKDQAGDMAAQLQILSKKPFLEERLTSFTESLSHVSLCRCEDCECEVTQIPKPDGSPIGDHISVDSGKGKRPAAEDRRGSNENENPVCVPSKTISSDSESHFRRISSKTISSPSSSASGGEESWGENNELKQLEWDFDDFLIL